MLMEERRRMQMESWMLNVIRKIQGVVKEDLEMTHGVEIHPHSVYLACSIVVTYSGAFRLGSSMGGAGDDASKEELLQKDIIGLVEAACVKLNGDLDGDREGSCLGLDEYSLIRTFVELTESVREKLPSRGVWANFIGNEYKALTDKWVRFRKKVDSLPLEIYQRRGATLGQIRLLVLSCLEEAQKLEDVIGSNLASVEELAAKISGLKLSFDKDFRHNITLSPPMIAKLGAHFAKLILLIDDKELRQIITVSPHSIAEAASSIIGVPASWLLQLVEPKHQCSIDDEDSEEHELGGRLPKSLLIGQEHVVLAVTTALSLRWTCPAQQPRPIGSFLFLVDARHGATGRLSKALADQIFDNNKDIVIKGFDMSEYTDSESVRRLMGFHNRLDSFDKEHSQDGPNLTEFIKDRPFSIVELDNIERAHESVADMLIEILSTGVLRDGLGNVFDFTRTMFFMRSGVLNMNSRKWGCNCPRMVQWFPLKDDVDRVLDHDCLYLSLIREARQHLRPGLFEKLDDVVVFDQLSPKKVNAVARLHLRDMASACGGDSLILYPSEAALHVLKDDALGVADHVRAKIRTWLEENFSTMSEERDPNDVAIVYIDVLVGTSELSYRVDTVNGMMEDLGAKRFLCFLKEFKSTLRSEMEQFRKIYLLRKSFFELIDDSEGFGDGKDYVIATRMKQLVDAIDGVMADFSRTSDNSNKIALASLDEKFNLMHGEVPQERARVPCTYFPAGMYNPLLFLSNNYLARRNKPFMSLLLLGLTAVGKENLISDLGRHLSGMDGRKGLVHINLSECDDHDMFFKLIYAECKEAQGSEGVRESPCVVFLDLVENANVSVFSGVLHLLDRGSLQDHEGCTIDSRGSIIILTSDLGCKDLIAEICRHAHYECDCSRVASNAHSCAGGGGPGLGGPHFRFESLNRVEDVVFFDPYTRSRQGRFSWCLHTEPRKNQRDPHKLFSCFQFLFHMICERDVQSVQQGIGTVVSYLVNADEVVRISFVDCLKGRLFRNNKRKHETAYGISERECCTSSIVRRVQYGA